MRPRDAAIAAFLALLALVAMLGVATGTAGAQTTPPPTTCAQATTAEVDARAAAAAALPPLREFNPNVYPGGTVPTIAQLPDLLDDILADPDLGGEARALVDAAVKLQTTLTAATAARVTACAPTTTTTPNRPTTTPNPTPTTPNPTTTNPTTSPAPDVDEDDGQALPVDNDPSDGVAYRPNVSGGIATGGR